MTASMALRINARLRRCGYGAAAVLAICATPAMAAGLPAVTVTTAPGGGQAYSVTLQALLFMTALTMLPAALLMMSAFTRIVVVLSLLRQAIGTGATPSNQILIGLSLFLTAFVMSPVLNRMYDDAVQPYMDGKIDVQPALQRAEQPLRAFMLAQTRNTDLMTFARISGHAAPYASPAEVPFMVLAPAFMTSELTTAFQIGFLLFIPFIVIDLVVSSVLMSMGMVMLSPILISLPFKLMLFVLVDGWSLVMGSLAASFRAAAV